MGSLLMALLLLSIVCTLPVIECDGNHYRFRRQLATDEYQEPVNDPSKGIPWHVPTKIRTVVKGTPHTTGHRVFFRSEHGLISPLHDIPLYSNHDHQIFNMVVEIPRLSTDKIEMSLEETLNPLKHATSNGQLRCVPHVPPYYGSMINYGALPNTWDNPYKVDPHTGYKGGGDPLDVVEIGDRVAKLGEVIQVKVLGAMGMIDNNRTDWKLIAIDVNNAKASKLYDITDVEKHFPGYLKSFADWLATVNIKKKLAFNGKIKNRAFAQELIDAAQKEWIELMAQLGDEKEIYDYDSDEEPSPPPPATNMSLVNTCLRGSIGKISFEEAEAILGNRTFPTGRPAENSDVYQINITARGSKSQRI